MSKYVKKRKHDLDVDTSGDNGPSPEKFSKRSRRREASGSPDRDDGGGHTESMSIEETNALRAKLGLAPLVVEEEAPKMRESESGDTTEKVVTQDGMEFVHVAAKSITQKKLEDKLKEKIETHQATRKVQAKVLKAKGLADSSDEEEGGVDQWIEAQRRKAEETAKTLDQLDGEIEQAAAKRPKRPPTSGKRRQRPAEDESLAGMTVGHSKSSFMTGEETILVLDDKNVLDDDGEEVLVNPTLMYNEQLRKNKELREKKPGYNPYDDETVDEFGQVQRKSLLAKYDEGIDGPVGRETFKLNSRGALDIAREEEELRVKRNLHMANKQLQSLETPKYKVASEFYTEEEMISFRKPKKKEKKSSRKLRGSKSSALKADDLMPLEPEPETEEEKAAREAKLKARREGGGKDIKEEPETAPEVADAEDGEIIEAPKPEKTRFRSTMGATVDTSTIRSLASKLAAESDDSDEDDLGPTADLQGVVIDDEVEDEVAAALARNRRELALKAAAAAMDGATAVNQLRSQIKQEEPDEEAMEAEDDEKGVVFDATAEYYKTIGARPTYGLAGNREDEVDFSELHAEEAREQEKKERRRKEREAEAAEEERRRVKREKKHLLAASSKKEKESKSKDDDRHHRKHRHRDEDDDEDVDMEAVAEESGTRKDNKKGEHENVLGKERDVTKGIAGMLKLAGEKGYLEDPNAKKNRGGTLKHLESKNFAKVEFTNHGIEDKYLKKLERGGTTGGGPIRPFVEKRDYNPQIEIAYTDAQGREMEPKAAFRNMSHKFHGKAPGKKQVEKRMRQQEKKEKMKKMNSFDTPLGTLSKQVKKQEQTGSHYIILSGNSRDTGAPLQKE